jgi:hypothetical protein
MTVSRTIMVSVTIKAKPRLRKSKRDDRVPGSNPGKWSHFFNGARFRFLMNLGLRVFRFNTARLGLDGGTEK